MADAIKDAYAEILHINERPSENDRGAIEGKFKSVHNGTDRIAKEQARTFFGLLDLADLDKVSKKKPLADSNSDKPAEPKEKQNGNGNGFMANGFSGLRYNIEIHLPPTKDVEVYNAIFKSLKVHLLDD